MLPLFLFVSSVVCSWAYCLLPVLIMGRRKLQSLARYCKGRGRLSVQNWYFRAYVVLFFLPQSDLKILCLYLGQWVFGGCRSVVVVANQSWSVASMMFVMHLLDPIHHPWGQGQHQKLSKHIFKPSTHINLSIVPLPQNCRQPSPPLFCSMQARAIGHWIQMCCQHSNQHHVLYLGLHSKEKNLCAMSNLLTPKSRQLLHVVPPVASSSIPASARKEARTH